MVNVIESPARHSARHAVDGTKPANDLAARRSYLEIALGQPFVEGNSVEPLNNGERIFPAMLNAIRNSRFFIEFLTYIYWTGDIAEEMANALCERAQAGVSVKVLLDSMGSADIDDRLVDKMEKAGVDVCWFRPIRRSFFRYDWRTHRKVLICDGKVGFTGGVGIAKEWEGDARNESEWRETHFKITGPSVRYLRGAFQDNWIEVSKELPIPQAAVTDETNGNIPLQVIQSHSGFRTCNAYKVLHALINLAESKLDIISPYFVPEEDLRELICEKARSGVRVRVLIPGKYTDKRFERLESARYFDELMSAGVEIHLYQKTMIHTKLVLCDDHFAMFGSINFNRRSLGKDEEIGVIAASEKFVRSLRQTMDEDVQEAKRLDPIEWEGPDWKENVTHLLLSPFREQL